jgi:hypothetical protein
MESAEKEKARVAPRSARSKAEIIDAFGAPERPTEKKTAT